MENVGRVGLCGYKPCVDDVSRVQSCNALLITKQLLLLPGGHSAPGSCIDVVGDPTRWYADKYSIVLYRWWAMPACECCQKTDIKEADRRMRLGFPPDKEEQPVCPDPMQFQGN